MKQIEYAIPVAKPWLGGDEVAYVLAALRSGQLSAGSMLGRFETEFARWLGVKHAVACSSGTGALHLACLLAEVGSDNEVIIPDLAFVAVANAVRYCGATPVAVDVHSEDLTLDINQVRAAITAKTRAVIAVHTYGATCAMSSLRSLCAEAGLVLIEDAAEALGSSHKGRLAGGMGNIGVFSFYGNKTLTTGEGGMLVTNDAYCALLARTLRGQGQTPGAPYHHGALGFNYRMTELQAAVGLAQLEQVDRHLNARRRVRRLYINHMTRLGLFERGVRLQGASNGSNPVWWMTVVFTPPKPAGEVRAALAARGIEARPVFVPASALPLSPLRLASPDSPNSAWAHKFGVVLPTFAEMDGDMVATVCAALSEAIK